MDEVGGGAGLKVLLRHPQALETLLERTAAMSYVLPANGVAASAYLCPKAERLLGVTSEVFAHPSRGWATLLHAQDRARVLAEVAAQEARGESFSSEYRVVVGSGETRWLRDDAVFIEGEGAAGLTRIGLLLDTTQVKRAEEIWRRCETFLGEAQELANLGSYERDWKTGEGLWSPAFFGILGYDPALTEPTHESFWAAIHPEDRRGFRDRMIEALAEHTSYQHEFRVVRPDGQERAVRAVGRYTYGEDGKPRWHRGIFQDITGWALAVRELRDSEARLRHLFENAPVSLWQEDFSLVRKELDRLLKGGVKDLSAYIESHPEFVRACVASVRIRDVNQAALDLHGAETKAELRSSLTKTFTAQSYEGFRGLLLSMVGDGTIFETEGVVKTLAGEPHSVLVKCFRDPRTDDWSNLYIALVDVTVAKRAEERRIAVEARLKDAQRAKSLSVLASGVAHDFSSLLMVILGNAHGALSTTPSNEPAFEHLTEVCEAAERATDLVKKMLSYSGRGRFVSEVADLGVLVDKVVGGLRPSLGEGLELRVLPATGDTAVTCDPSQVRQLLDALLLNAIEAVGQGPGEVEVRMGELVWAESTPGKTAVPLLAELEEKLVGGRLYRYVEVRDTGCGMAAVVREKMFEPFFSTKFPGRGLGMAAVLGIVRGHCGAIQVKSAPKLGTTVRVLLPVEADPETPKG